MLEDRYRIIIHVIRGSAAGRALKLMAAGLVITAETVEKARELLDEYLDCAEPILCSANQGRCFGVAGILDCQDGSFLFQSALMGKGTVIRRAAGELGEIAQTAL